MLNDRAESSAKTEVREDSVANCWEGGGLQALPEGWQDTGQIKSVDGVSLRETLHRRLKFCRESKSGTILPSYFLGRTESFIALPTRNFNVVLAGI